MLAPRRPRTTAAALALVVLGCSAPLAAHAGRFPDHGTEDVHARPTVDPAPVLEDAYRFTSYPDFLNQDVGDLGDLAPEGSDIRGTNGSYERSIGYVLDEVAGFEPSAFLVAGDLVEGRWGTDPADTGVFGPADTAAQRRDAVRRAADTYYDAWRRRLLDRGLVPYPALGDHEIGDNPWRDGKPTVDEHWTDFKRRNVGVWKEAFSAGIVDPVRAASTVPAGPVAAIDTVGGVSSPTAGQASGTAYAVRLDPRVLLVSLDVFKRSTTRRDIEPAVDPAQLDWLRQVLERAQQADVPWVVVQGHVPVLGPVRTRRSSRLAYEGGASSPLWTLMRSTGVDVYLCGEVHDHTATFRDGILQLAHGALLYAGEASYVNAQVTEDEMVLETHQFRGNTKYRQGLLWSVSGGNGPARVSYAEPSRVVGTLVLTREATGNRLERTTGIDDPYVP